MTVDLQVIYPQETVALTSVDVVPGLLPATIAIVGADFGSVDEVLINDVASPDVIVLSKTKLLAQIPDGMRPTDLLSVSVTSRRLTLTARSLLRFQISNTPRKVSGILRLMQLFVKLLFTSPGTDIFSPQLGGGGLRRLGQTFSAQASGDIVSDFVISVDTTVRQIIALQGRDASIPPDERLLSARVTNAGFVKAETALIVTIELSNQTGQSERFNLEL